MRGSVAAMKGVLPILALATLAACEFSGNGPGVTHDAVPPPDAPFPDGHGDAAIPDLDGDGVPDATDRCPTVADDQHDEDGDLVGDACDNCPTVANPDQANVGETMAGAAADGAGDACDPFPRRPGNDIVLFESFANPSPLWTVDGGAWSFAADAATQTRVDGVGRLYWGGDPTGDVVVDTVAALVATPPGGASIGILAQWSPTTDSAGVRTAWDSGYLCQLYDTPTVNLQAHVFWLQSATLTQLAAAVAPGASPTLGPGTTWRLRQLARRTERACEARSDAGGGLATTVVASGAVPSGRIALRAAYAQVRFDSVIVYAAP